MENTDRSGKTAMDDRSSPGVMIVTGGSRGIGASVALLAARHGYSVAVNFAGNERAADLVVGAIREAGAKAIAVQGDVSLERDVTRLFKTVDEELGSVSVLVNNAGITGGVSTLAEVSA